MYHRTFDVFQNPLGYIERETSQLAGFIVPRGRICCRGKKRNPAIERSGERGAKAPIELLRNSIQKKSVEGKGEARQRDMRIPLGWFLRLPPDIPLISDD